jgi:hypothetical protein
LLPEDRGRGMNADSQCGSEDVGLRIGFRRFFSALPVRIDHNAVYCIHRCALIRHGTLIGA